MSMIMPRRLLMSACMSDLDQQTSAHLFEYNPFGDNNYENTENNPQLLRQESNPICKRSVHQHCPRRSRFLRLRQHACLWLGIRLH